MSEIEPARRETPGVPAGAGAGEPRRDDGSRLDRDVSCVRCSYNLRGLAADGHCPECGEETSASIRGTLPRITSAGYCRWMMSGLTLITRCAILVLVLFIALLANNIVGTGSVETRLGLAAYAFAAVVGGLISLGYWRLTTPDGTQPRETQPVNARRIIRASAVFMPLATLLHLSASLFEVGSLRKFSGLSVEALIYVFQASLLAVWAIRQSATACYVAWLASRLPDTRLQVRAARYRWLLPTIFIGLFLAYGVGVLVSSIMLWVLLDDVRKRLRFVERAIKETANSTVATR